MISFIYFDVGGVVVDDFSGNNKWQELKDELGITATTAPGFEKIWARYSPELCIDRDVETLVPILKKELGIDLPADYSLLDGFVRRFYANPSIWPVIQDVHQKTRVGLLTNMYPGMFAAIEQKHILPDVQWDIIVDSSIELLQKPDERLFELAAQRADVPNGEILFVDNGPEHVQAAEAFGWQTFLCDASNLEAAAQALQQFLSAQTFRR